MSVLGWRPRWSLDRGLDETIKYFQQEIDRLHGKESPDAKTIWITELPGIL